MGSCSGKRAYDKRKPSLGILSALGKIYIMKRRDWEINARIRKRKVGLQEDATLNFTSIRDTREEQREKGSCRVETKAQVYRV